MGMPTIAQSSTSQTHFPHPARVEACSEHLLLPFQNLPCPLCFRTLRPAQVWKQELQQQGTLLIYVISSRFLSLLS